MFETKVYTSHQRNVYGWGWFAISFVIGLILISLEWNKLGFIAFLWGALSLYTGYFGKNNDSKNPKILMCPKCQILHELFNLNNNEESTIFAYEKIRVRSKDGLHIYPLICFNCKNLTEYASDSENYSGNSTCGFEYFKTKKVSKKNLNDAMAYAKKEGCASALKKLKTLFN
tara:strand:- start:492 stop:1007 length:516 start_codon:yes stop_codon:yes gene_type:complete